LTQILLFVLLGLGQGALIAGIALGVVVTYRGSGVINLATGAVAMVAGYAFWSLHTGHFGVALGLAGTLVVQDPD
jgi:branched-chain amino acid transport system permease protein